MKKVFFAIALLATLFTIQACSSPDFQRGFREGWNATAPAEYRY